MTKSLVKKMKWGLIKKRYVRKNKPKKIRVDSRGNPIPKTELEKLHERLVEERRKSRQKGYQQSSYYSSSSSPKELDSFGTRIDDSEKTKSWMRDGAMPTAERRRRITSSPFKTRKDDQVLVHSRKIALPASRKKKPTQTGSMGKLSIPSTVKPSSAIELPKEEERKIPRPKEERNTWLRRRRDRKEAKRIFNAERGKETGTYSVSGEDYRKQQAAEAAAKRKKIKQPSSGGGAPTISEEIGKKERSAFCENCGNTLKPTAKFCGKCGTPVS